MILFNVKPAVINLEQLLQDFCSLNQPIETLPSIICFPVSSSLVITFELSFMACLLTLSNLNCTKTFINRQIFSDCYCVLLAFI